MAAYNFQNDRGVGNEPFDLESLLALIRRQNRIQEFRPPFRGASPAGGSGGLSTLRPEAAPPQSITPTDPDAPEPIRPRGYVEPYDVASTIGREPEATEPGLSGFQKFQGISRWLAPHVADVASVLGRPEASQALARQRGEKRQAGLDALYQLEIERRGALQESQARSQAAERTRQTRRQTEADVIRRKVEERAAAGFGGTPEEKAARIKSAAVETEGRAVARTIEREKRGEARSTRERLRIYAEKGGNSAKISEYATRFLSNVGWNAGNVTAEHVESAKAMLARAVLDKQGMTEEFVRAHAKEIGELIKFLGPRTKGDFFDAFLGDE